MNPRRGSLQKFFFHQGAGLLCRLLLVFILLSPSYADENLLQVFEDLVDNGSCAVQLQRKLVIARNIETTFIPASTLKIFTALMALELLGPDYRCTTGFFLDQENNLYIKGGGDPLLISEAVDDIAKELLDRKITDINTLILDTSLFALESPPPGSKNSENPYDAGSGALAVNFNAIPFRVLESGSAVSSEPQTPTLPLMQNFAAKRKPGKYRINVTSQEKRQLLSNSLTYSGELFTAVFEKKGITISKKFSHGKTPKDAQHLFTYRSSIPLTETIRQVLHYSNNYMANQLFLHSGMKQFGAPATWEKARLAAEILLNQLNISPNDAHIEDGSGLSTGNNISAADMLKILDHFRPHANLLRYEDFTYIKSGTLTGVYCYAGYFGSKGNLVPFVIFLNQKRNTRKPLLQSLYRAVQHLQSPVSFQEQ